MEENKKPLNETEGLKLEKKEEEQKPTEQNHFVLKVQDSSISNTSNIGGK